MSIMNTTISGGGTTPTGTITITSNGITDVTNYANADVQVPTTAPALYREFEIDVAGKLVSNKTTTHIMDFTGVKQVNAYTFYQAYQGNTNISGSVNMPDLDMFANDSTQAFGSAFGSCTGITGFNAPNLKIIASSAMDRMFAGCSNLSSVILSSLYDVRNGAFDYTFFNCSSLTSLGFPSLKNVQTSCFNRMCYGIQNITLHFPSNMQTAVEALTGYSTTAPFGAVAGTVLFDLPATNTLTGVDTNVYTRNPKYDSGTALAWKVGAYGTSNFTPAYYTSGLTDPTVGTTIYSDAACTTSVTTVDSIA